MFEDRDKHKTSETSRKVIKTKGQKSRETYEKSGVGGKKDTREEKKREEV
jgi:hypothetical protein